MAHRIWRGAVARSVPRKEQRVIFTDDQDREKFLQSLGEMAERFDIDIFASDIFVEGICFNAILKICWYKMMPRSLRHAPSYIDKLQNIKKENSAL